VGGLERGGGVSERVVLLTEFGASLPLAVTTLQAVRACVSLGVLGGAKCVDEQEVVEQWKVLGVVWAVVVRVPIHMRGGKAAPFDPFTWAEEV
jgi:hypothetical protein